MPLNKFDYRRGFAQLREVLRRGRFAVLAISALVAPPAYSRVASVEESQCPADAVCGVLMRPLDPSGHVKGNVPIAWRLYLHRSRNAAAADTIVTQEGGPGYPSIGSHYGYLRLFAPLRDDHDILMIDARGTGYSALRCKSVQKLMRTPHDVGACGRSLGPASDFYGTRLAAEDMAAVLDRLGIGKIDYYGDSYGTFFGQVFAALYPGRLRSVVLDSAYPVIGESPWYPHAGDIVRKGFQLTCARSPYCASLGGNTLDRIRRLVRDVHDRPLKGRAPDADGNIRSVAVDPGTIGNVLYDGSQGPVNYRDLDAAIRALYDGHDALPLLRLVAENNENEDPTPPKQFSYALFAAVSCMDYQQIYEMRAPPNQREEQREAAVVEERQTDPKVYDPLTIAEFETVPIDTSVLNLCLDWPVRDPPYDPGKPIPRNDTFTDAPTLVLSGELDMLTTPAEGRIVTRQFPNGRHIVFANSFHVQAVLDTDDCAQVLVRRFVRTLDPGDISCAAQIAPVRLVPFFARWARDVIPAEPRGTNTATERELAYISAAVQTAGDAFERWNVNNSGHDVGLRGGKWSYTQKGTTTYFTLDRVLWTEDLPVSGTIMWKEESGEVRAKLRFRDPDGNNADIGVRWEDHDRDAVASLSGRIGDRIVNATMAAP